MTSCILGMTLDQMKRPQTRMVVKARLWLSEEPGGERAGETSMTLKAGIRKLRTLAIDLE